MINPSYISGYVDGEGSFFISFSLREKFSLGIEVRPTFSISQRRDRSEVLRLIKSYFGCGSIRTSRRDGTLRYEVRSIKDLREKIIPHFERYALLSSKRKEFKYFSLVCSMISDKKHLTKKGLIKIIDLITLMNVGGSRRYSKEYLLSRLKI